MPDPGCRVLDKKIALINMDKSNLYDLNLVSSF